MSSRVCLDFNSQQPVFRHGAQAAEKANTGADASSREQGILLWGSGSREGKHRSCYKHKRARKTAILSLGLCFIQTEQPALSTVGFSAAPDQLKDLASQCGCWVSEVMPGAGL